MQITELQKSQLAAVAFLTAQGASYADRTDLLRLTRFPHLADAFIKRALAIYASLRVAERKAAA